LMMIDRLETKIGRMEARLQELGFDIASDRMVTAPSFPEGPDDSQSGTPAFPESDNTTEDKGEVCSENMHAGSQVLPTTTVPDLDRYVAEPSLYDEEDHSTKDDLANIFIPRCLLDKPTTGGEFSAMLHILIHIIDQASRKAFYPLPPKEEVLSILDDFLQNFNKMCPLFQPAKLVALFQQDKLDINSQSPACWASINVVLALGTSSRVKNWEAVQPDYQKSWFFIKNALSVLNRLCLGPASLWSIQALLGIIVFLLGTMASEPCNLLIATAIRFCHDLGLERMDNVSAMNPEESEQRRRVFWIAYSLDRDISLRSGKPLAQSDDDVSIGLPTTSHTDPQQTIPTKNTYDCFDAFIAHCQLATIKGQLYKALYSAAAENRPLGEIMTSIGILDEKLEHWKRKLPSEYQPEAQICPLLPQSPAFIMLLFLHYSYFNCVIAIHRLVASRGINIGMDLPGEDGICLSASPPPRSRVFMSASLCADAARASVKLMRYLPEGDYAVVGFLIHYPIVALKSLSSTIIRNPRSASRLTDMKLIGQVEAFLSSLAVNIPNDGIKQIKTYCTNCRSAAEDAIQKTIQFCGT
ncbi:hypothetical protein AOCH_001059, partial [Aspergillus ochraceoroseus]